MWSASALRPEHVHAREAPRPAYDLSPLSGIRVLDLTRLLPGPVCTLHLADFGADVIKIEDTGAGDYARTMGETHGDGESAMSDFFVLINRNKRAISST